MSKCPGNNPNVLKPFAVGAGLASAATAKQANQAQREAEGKALIAAMSDFAKNLCSPPCISIPTPHLIASGADVINQLEGGDLFFAFGWAKAQLDVFCIQVPNPPVPAPKRPLAPLLPADPAPVTEKSKTRKP